MITPLKQAQYDFCDAANLLITQARSLGFKPRLGEAWRSTEQALRDAEEGKGIVHSNHTIRLALDLLLDDADGNYLTDSSAYRPLGDWWKALDSRCCWGGDFSRPDGNHFSFIWQGVK
jgi:hypothetical protein